MEEEAFIQPRDLSWGLGQEASRGLGGVDSKQGPLLGVRT